MKINYVENKNGKLFSFHSHDYKDNIDDEDNYIMIDGGFDDYIRCSGELKSGEIKDLMPEIREQFKWGNNFDENNNRLPITIWVLLKDMSTSHISGVIRYFTENIRPEQVLTKQWIAYHLIFCYELENRLKQ